MGAAAHNRGSRVIREQTDRALAGRPRFERCGGKFYNGLGKRFVRCACCQSVDYEANEGDTCTRTICTRKVTISRSEVPTK